MFEHKIFHLWPGLLLSPWISDPTNHDQGPHYYDGAQILPIMTNALNIMMDFRSYQSWPGPSLSWWISNPSNHDQCTQYYDGFQILPIITRALNIMMDLRSLQSWPVHSILWCISDPSKHDLDPHYHGGAQILPVMSRTLTTIRLILIFNRMGTFNSHPRRATLLPFFDCLFFLAGLKVELTRGEHVQICPGLPMSSENSSVLWLYLSRTFNYLLQVPSAEIV